VLLRQYRIYTTGDKAIRDVLEEIISGDTVLKEYSGRAIIVYNFPDSNILPAEHYKTDLHGPVSHLINGDTENGYIFNEQIREWDMQNIYSIPKDIHSLFKEKFQGSQYWHFYTLMMVSSKNEELTKGNISRMIFYNDKFVLGFFKDGMLQLLQTFTYQTPEDAAYYLLLICKQLGISQHDMVLNISGLIDSQSALYTELLKFFPEVNYEGIPEVYNTNGLLDEYPSHYFSPLLKMSLCV
jgi:hypothetical protein